MISGMLWFNDNRTAPLQTRLEQAVHDYQKCYGLYPTLCCLSPGEISQQQRAARRLHLALSASDQLREGQFWLGNE